MNKPINSKPVALPEPDDYKQEIDSENCMQCSVAYLLGLPLHMVPDFAAQETSQLCWELFESFISSQGYAAVMLTGIYEFETDYLASGTSPRGIPHMVVMNDGNLVHDPHPSNAGISDVQCIWLITRRALLAGVSAPAAQAVDARELQLAMQEASNLAQSIFKRHYSDDEHYASGSVVWELCGDLRGVLSQISNMVSGLVRAPQAQADARDELTASELQELRRAADDFNKGCDTDVEHDLLVRGAIAGYLYCERFAVLDGFALNVAIAESTQT